MSCINLTEQSLKTSQQSHSSYSFLGIEHYAPVVNVMEEVRGSGSSLTVKVADVLLDIEGFKKELAALTPLYCAISKRYEQVQADIAKRKSLLSPIRRLPSEV